MRDPRGELAAGARYYVLAVCTAAVADDRAFDERAALDGRVWAMAAAAAALVPAAVISAASGAASAVVSTAVASAEAKNRQRQRQ